MSAYHKQRLEEKVANLERRRAQLRALLQEERDRLEAELREIDPRRGAPVSQLVQKTEERGTATEERRKKVVILNYFYISLLTLNERLEHTEILVIEKLQLQRVIGEDYPFYSSEISIGYLFYQVTNYGHLSGVWLHRDHGVQSRNCYPVLL